MQRQKEREKESKDVKETGRWSAKEHELFMVGIMQFGKDWKKVEQLVGTRNGSQVRSHAQKFFNKIQKEQKEKKEKKPKAEISDPQKLNELDFSETQNDIGRSLWSDQATPIELVSLIRKQSRPEGKVNLNSLKKSLETEEGKEDNQLNALQELKKCSSFRSMNNILSAYENINEAGEEKEDADQGFLILLTKKYKKYFGKDSDFSSLIDFGNPQELANAVKTEKSIRKRSFTFLDGVVGNEETLEEIRKMIKTDAACDRKEKVVEEKREIREVSLETDNANQCEAEVKFSETQSKN